MDQRTLAVDHSIAKIKRDYERSKSGKKSIMAVNQSDGAEYLQTNDIAEDEALVFGTFGAFWAAIIVYACWNAGEKPFSAQRKIANPNRNAAINGPTSFSIP